MPDTFTRQDMTPSTFYPLEPSLYHAHHRLRAEDIFFWKSLANEFDGPILELGCGTGRILLPLLNDGFSATGLDTDPAMLTYLRGIASPLGQSSLNLHQADMRTFQFPDRFGLVILPCNTYSTFPSEERRQIIQSVSKHLNPMGIFVFAVPNPDLLASLEPFSEFELEETFPHPDTGYPVNVFSQWKKTTDTLTFTWRYDHRIPNGNTISQLAITRHHLDTTEMYLQELQTNGLTPIQLYGDFERNLYRPDEATYLIILAQSQLD